MNQPAIHIPRGFLSGAAARFFQIIAIVHRPRAVLARQMEATIAPLPEFGLPSDQPEGCYELRGSQETLLTIYKLLMLLPLDLRLGCTRGLRDCPDCGWHLIAMRLTLPAVQRCFRELCARQANAVRGLTYGGSEAAWPEFARNERARRLLAAALGLSLPQEAAIE